MGFDYNEILTEERLDIKLIHALVTIIIIVCKIY